MTEAVIQVLAIGLPNKGPAAAAPATAISDHAPNSMPALQTNSPIATSDSDGISWKPIT
jgi:hypothetical protein